MDALGGAPGETLAGALGEAIGETLGGVAGESGAATLPGVPAVPPGPAPATLPWDGMAGTVPCGW